MYFLPQENKDLFASNFYEYRIKCYLTFMVAGNEDKHLFWSLNTNLLGIVLQEKAWIIV